MIFKFFSPKLNLWVTKSKFLFNYKKLFNFCSHKVILILFIPTIGQAQSSSSPLSDGTLIKIGITKNGVYKINEKFLKKVGISLNDVSLNNIKVYGAASGMIDQKNVEPNLVALKECSLFYSDNSELFNSTNFILFYGEGPDKVIFQEKEQTFVKKNNIYSDTNYYFIKINSSPSKRITTRESVNGHPSNIISVFDDYIFHEREEYNLLNSGREWFGEKFGKVNSYDFSFPEYNFIPNSKVKLSIGVVSKASSNSSFNYLLNGTYIGKLTMPIVTSSSSGIAGIKQEKTFIIEADGLTYLEDVLLKISYNTNSSSTSVAYLDYFNLHFKSKLKFKESGFSFRSIKSAQNTFSTFRISNCPEDLMIWDITDPFSPQNQSYEIHDDYIAFTTNTLSQIKEFFTFKIEECSSPVYAKKISNQSLWDKPTPELLIVSHPIFYDEAKRLAEFKENHDSLKALVITSTEIFNEISAGKPDPSAIRNFIRYLYQKNPNKLKYLLLFGDASYDYKNVIETYSSIKNTNFVPTYQSRESLHPIYSFASDDFYGFLDENEGFWPEVNDPDQNIHDLELGIGRLPVSTHIEAVTVVDKIINYQTDDDCFGSWRNSISFVADDGDLNIHQTQAEKLADIVQENSSDFILEKFYTDAFPQLGTEFGEVSPLMNETLNRQIEKGSLIINYTGHGSERGWTSEQVLRLNDVVSWENYSKLPFMFTATCDFGKFDQPTQKSGAEYALLNPQGGAIALMTTTRNVFSNNNFRLNETFFKTLLESKNSRKILRLGDIVMQIKNSNPGLESAKNFTLLGDPSLRLAFPKHEIRIKEINGAKISEIPDTLTTNQEIELSGEILQNGTLFTDFSGELEFSFLGEKKNVTTLGNEGTNLKMNFLNKGNILFQGKTSVAKGKFVLKFIIPRNAKTKFYKGLFSLYAFSPTLITDANGNYSNFLVTENSEILIQENQPPEVNVFLQNEFFKEGVTVFPSTTLILKIFDESGINLENSEAGTTAILDPDSISTQYPIGDFYFANKDDYRNGIINFPLKKLSNGLHKLWIVVNDNLGNKTEREIVFKVSNNLKLKVDKLDVYPNPSKSNFHFKVKQNLESSTLEYDLLIYDSQGNQVTNKKFYDSSNFTYIQDINLNMPYKRGLFFYKLIIYPKNNPSNSVLLTGKIRKE